VSSETKQEPLSVEAAYSAVQRSVLEPVFFQKLAQLGITPANDYQRRQLLEIGTTLFQHHSAELAKEASVAENFLSFAHQNLLGPAPSEEEIFAKRASDYFVSNVPGLEDAAALLWNVIQDAG
jgi:hypothetical protein